MSGYICGDRVGGWVGGEGEVRYAVLRVLKGGMW